MMFINDFAQLWLAVAIFGFVHLYYDSRMSLSDPYAYQIFPTLPGYKRWLFRRMLTVAFTILASVLWVVSLFV